MHQRFFRPNFIFNKDAYFLDFHTQKFPLIFFNVSAGNVVAQWPNAPNFCLGPLEISKLWTLVAQIYLSGNGN